MENQEQQTAPEQATPESAPEQTQTEQQPAQAEGKKKCFCGSKCPAGKGMPFCLVCIAVVAVIIYVIFKFI